MKKEDLFETIGDIKEEYVEEAHKEYVVKKKRSNAWKKYVPVVAGLAALFAVTVIFGDFVKDMPGTQKEEEAVPEEGMTDKDGLMPETEELMPEDETEESATEEGSAEEGSEGESGKFYDEIAEIKYNLPDSVIAFLGGIYTDADGKLHCIITEDNEKNRNLICEEYELDENDIIFEKGKYTLDYLVELESKISKVSDNGELPNLISYEIVEKGNYILVQVKKETKEEMKILEKLDTIGGAIMVEEEETEDVTVRNSSSYNPEDNFSFSLTWGCYGLSFYDSKTGKLVKTTDATNPEDYVTEYQLTDEDKEYFQDLISSLDADSYPDEYDPGNGKSAPSMTLILTMNIDGVEKTIKAEDIALSYESKNKKGQRFLSVCEKISDRLMETKEWEALPEYEILYD